MKRRTNIFKHCLLMAVNLNFYEAQVDFQNLFFGAGMCLGIEESLRGSNTE